MSEKLASNKCDTSIIIPEVCLKVHNRKKLKEPSLTRKNNPRGLLLAVHDNKTPHLVVILDEARDLRLLS